MSSKKCVLALCGGLFAGAGAGTAASYSPRVGEAHPDFILPRADDGKPVALSDFRGKKTLLIHFSSW